MAGDLLGTFWGAPGTPKRWNEGLEKGEEIVNMAKELIDCCLQGA